MKFIKSPFTYTGSDQNLYLDFPHYDQNIYYSND